MNIVIIPSAKLASLHKSWKKEDINGCIDDYCQSLKDMASDLIISQHVIVTSNCCFTKNNIIEDNQDRRVGGDTINKDVMVYEEIISTKKTIDINKLKTDCTKDIKYICNERIS